MSAILSPDGQNLITKLLFAQHKTENMVFHLYTNDYTPLSTSGINNYVDVVDPEYKSIEYDNILWHISSSATTTTAKTGDLAWMFSSSAAGTTIYGYYVTTASSNVYLFAERFSVPLTAPTTSDFVKLTSEITLT